MAAPKKDPTARRRRNKAASAATLGQAKAAGKPRLPQYVPGAGAKVRWHPLALAWWDSVWRSPMAREFLHADARGLIRLAVLEHSFWITPIAADRARLAGEIRLQQQAYGLTPYDRRRLEWNIEMVERVQDRSQQRRAAGTSARTPQQPAQDPRSMLRLA